MPWPARAVEGPAAVRMQLDPEAGSALDVRLRMEIGPRGEPSDLWILSCQPLGGDVAAVAERLRTPGFRYCQVESGRIP